MCDVNSTLLDVKWHAHIVIVHKEAKNLGALHKFYT
jgi:hypothetical protein